MVMTFDQAQFMNGTVTFVVAQFTGAVIFNRAKFAGGRVTFRGAAVHRRPGHLRRAKFTGGRGHLQRGEGHRRPVASTGRRFTGGVVTRDGAEFRGWPPPDPEPEPAGPPRPAAG